ncbi:MAG TPA: hypothetical protein VGI19_16205 [Candidatus Cybelea sp.]|jgi:hypothetical protein
MTLKDMIAALFAPRKKSVVDGIREGETVMVQRRSGRLVYRMVEVSSDRGATLIKAKKRRLMRKTEDLGPTLKVFLVPKPEDLVFKVSSGK